MRLRAAACSATVILLLAGCGGSGNSSSTSTTGKRASASGSSGARAGSGSTGSSRSRSASSGATGSNGSTGAGGATGSTGAAASAGSGPSPKVLDIVAGSEQQAVLSDVVVPWCKQHGITCKYALLGSVDQARLLQSGKASYDAFWFASTVFEQLGDQANVLRDVQPMFITPVVFAGWKNVMQHLGLVGAGEPSIGQIIKLVESKKVTVWATNPTQSNSGATALLAFLNYFAGNPPATPLTMAQLNTPAVRDGVAKFIRAIAKTPPSTGTLTTDCVAHPDQCQAMFTYEDLVIQTDRQLVKQGREPLYAVYPRGSLAISDAPLGFLPHGNDTGKEQTFLALQRYLLSPPAQAKVEALGRRPRSSIGLDLPGANPSVFNPAWGIRAVVNQPIIHYPTVPVIEAALDNYQLSYRSPVSAYYCIDGSGSMGPDGGWAGVTAAANLLFNPAQAAKYLLQINSQDITTVDIFDQGIKARWTVYGNNPQRLLALRGDIEHEQPGGDTGIFLCLDRAAAQLASEPATNKRLVILMTDGMDNQGGNTNAIAALHVPVIAIGFSNMAFMGTLNEIAAQTGGEVFRSNDVVAALREATGYK